MNMWSDDMSLAPRTDAILLHVGETIPDMPDIRVGGYITADDAADLGEFFVSPDGAWLIWDSPEYWHVLMFNEPKAWRSIDLPAANRVDAA